MGEREKEREGEGESWKRGSEVCWLCSCLRTRGAGNGSEGGLEARRGLEFVLVGVRPQPGVEWRAWKKRDGADEAGGQVPLVGLARGGSRARM